MIIGIIFVIVVGSIIIFNPWEWDLSSTPQAPDIGIRDNDSTVSCSIFEGCPEGKEIISDANGESESDCCQKKTCEINEIQCPTSECHDDDGCWDAIPDARGDSPEECCVKALCSADKCDAGYKLRPAHSGRDEPGLAREPNSGRNNEDCCEPKSRCVGDICDTDGYRRKPLGSPPGSESGKRPLGDTIEECCELKECYNSEDEGMVQESRCGEEGANNGIPYVTCDSDLCSDPTNCCVDVELETQCFLDADGEIDTGFSLPGCVAHAGRPCSNFEGVEACEADDGDCVWIEGDIPQGNGWDNNKCQDPAKGGQSGWEQTPNPNNENIKGNTKEICCQLKTCVQNGWCPEAGADCDNSDECDTGYTTVEADSDVRGNNKEMCCIKDKCTVSGWGPDRCRIESDGQKPSFRGDTAVGNSVDECCEGRICSDYYFDGEQCPELQGGPDAEVSPEVTQTNCFTLANLLPLSPGEQISIDQRKLKTNCSYYDRKLGDGAANVPGVYREVEKRESCCIPKTCGEMDNAEDIETLCTGEDQTIPMDFIPTNNIPYDTVGLNALIPGGTDDDALIAACCSGRSCAQDYNSPADCERQYTENPPSLSADQDANSKFWTPKMGPNDRAEPSGFDNCCIRKTCGEAFPGDVDCQGINENFKKDPDPNKNSEPVEGDGRNCCIDKMCNEITLSCGDMEPKEDDVLAITPAGADGAECCQGKLCTELDEPWTDAKCKDKRYTRASSRGKLKEGGRVKSGQVGATATGATSSTASDEDCCEQDLTNNFARMCVGEEYHNGVRTNYSSGGTLHASQTTINAGSRDKVSPTECKRRCSTDPLCKSFVMHAGPNDENVLDRSTEVNPHCYKFRGFPEGTDIPNMVAQEFHVRPAILHYVSGENFPEEHRYSGRVDKSGSSAGHLIANSSTRSEEGATESWPARADSDPRSNATAAEKGETELVSLSEEGVGGAHDYDEREQILLAGVDKEFCPVDHVKAYGTWRSDFLWSIDAGTWHAPRDAMPVLHQAGEDGIGVVGGAGVPDDGQKGRNSGNCAKLSVANALDDCYRNLKCGANWFTSTGGNFDSDTSWIGKGGSMGRLHGDSSIRRYCPKQNLNIFDDGWPDLITDGGAFIHPTRRSTHDGMDGHGPHAVRYGVMPRKSKKAGEEHWDGMLLPGDDWFDVNPNNSH